MGDELVLVEVRDHVALITLNRPRVLNAIDVPMLLALEAAVLRLEADPAVRVMVVTGAGEKAFMAGGDIGGLNSRQGLPHYLEFSDVVHRVFRLFETSDKPNIAAINGYALGGGCELILAMDMRIMADTARLGLTEILLGIFPGGGGTQRAMRQIAPCVAREMMFTGDHVTAADALRHGLVNHVVPKAELLAAAFALAGRIAEKSPLTLKLLKRAMHHGLDMPLAAGLAYESSMISLVLDSADAHEGLGAFLEKRQPAFTGQ